MSSEMNLDGASVHADANNTCNLLLNLTPPATPSNADAPTLNMHCTDTKTLDLYIFRNWVLNSKISSDLVYWDVIIQTHFQIHT